LQLRKDRIASKKAADASQGSDKEKERKTDDEKEGEESDDDIIELDEWILKFNVY